MARNRTPQTQKKRRREIDKQLERQEKIVKRRERSAAKREAKRVGPTDPAAPAAVVSTEVSPANLPNINPTPAQPQPIEKS
jgi:hypothetical protein